MSSNPLAQRHIDLLLAENDSVWPKTLKGYIRLLWKIGRLRCRQRASINLAQLTPDGKGHWYVAYNSELPEKTICALLIHEASEYLSIQEHNASIEQQSIDDLSNGPISESNIKNGVPLANWDIFHDIANQTVKLWCSDLGYNFNQVMSIKTVFCDGPRTNFGYASGHPELERIPVGQEEGRTIGKRCD